MEQTKTLTPQERKEQFIQSLIDRIESRLVKMSRTALTIFAWLFMALSAVGLVVQDFKWLVFWGIAAVVISGFSRKD